MGVGRISWFGLSSSKAGAHRRASENAGPSYDFKRVLMPVLIALALVVLAAAASLPISTPGPRSNGAAITGASAVPAAGGSGVGRSKITPMAFGESIATFAADCTTAKTSFNLGDTVCAVDTGAPLFFFPLRRFLWAGPDGSVFQVGPAITSNPQSNSITIPASGSFALAGTWTVQSIDNSGEGFAVATFVVHDPANATADLSVFEAAPAQVNAGDSVTFTVFAFNNGPDPAQNVTLTVTYPANTSFVSETQVAGPTFTCTNGASTTCTIATLLPNAEAAFNFTYQVSGAVAGGTVLSSTATISSTTTELHPADNTASGVTTVSQTSGGACSLTCPGDMAHANDPGQQGAIVNYSAPSSSNCGNVTCFPASGSFFPTGTTTVTCSSDLTDDSCTFHVTVSGVMITINGANPMIVECHTGFTDPGATATDAGGNSIPVTPSGAVDPNTPGTYTITYTATSGSITVTASRIVNVVDTTPPVITCPQNIVTVPDPGLCTATVNFNVTATDTCSGVTVVSNPASGSAFPIGTTTVTSTATDASGNASTCTFTVTVTNPSPVVTITGPAAGSIFQVNTPVTFTGSFSGGGGTHSATWTFNNLTQAGTVNESTGAISTTFTFATDGIYFVTLTVNDSCGAAPGSANTVGALTAFVVIFDPSAGFVTGGGWFTSPAGDYPANPSLTGKATFGLDIKYHSTTPTGQTEFQFQAANIDLHSTSYDYLVVTSPKAQFQGSGTINRAGNFGFLVSAIEGDLSGGGGTNKIRIKIWDKNNGNAVVYDSQIGDPDTADPTTVLGGGSIKIH